VSADADARSGPVASTWLRCDWAAPRGVGIAATTRAGGVSAPPFGAADGACSGLNLGAHVGDDPAAVAANRARLAASLPGPVRWLDQVHGVDVHDADTAEPSAPPRADAAVTTRPDRVLAVLTADCLPVLLADDAARVVGIAHAGWRGLAAGVVESTVAAMRARAGRSARIVAWLGPAIGQAAFEVGGEVRDAFCDVDPAAASAFVRGARDGKWQADLVRLARQRLARAGVDDAAGCGLCTFADATRFWSHRRDGRGGRMASLIWIGRGAG
jgi:YfiH family protein